MILQKKETNLQLQGENKVQLSFLKVLGNPVFSGLPTNIDTLFTPEPFWIQLFEC